LQLLLFNKLCKTIFFTVVHRIRFLKKMVHGSNGWEPLFQIKRIGTPEYWKGSGGMRKLRTPLRVGPQER